MFEWLKGHDYVWNRKKDERIEIVEFDNEKGDFLVQNDNLENYTLELEDIKLNYHFTYTDNWEEKLFTKLLHDNHLHFNFWSLESNDLWNFEIKRIENPFSVGIWKDDNMNDKITIVNYAIVFCDQLIGDIFSVQLENESIEKFTEWIERQIEEVSLFNSPDHFNDLDGITMEYSLMSEEETNYIFDNLC